MDWNYYKIRNELSFFFGYDPAPFHDDEDAFAAASEDTYEATMIKKEGDLLIAFGEKPIIDDTAIKLIHGNAIMEIKQSFGQGFAGNPSEVDLKSLIPEIENGRIWFSKIDWQKDFEEYVPDFKTFTDLDTDIMQDLF